MKKIFLLSIILVLAYNANATKWRLNNNPGINANFSDWNSAYATANDNDTIFVEGSTISYGDITISKPLTIIGPGYFLSENPQTQKLLVTAKFGYFTINNGSSGSLITGLDITNGINIACGNISVIKNKLYAVYLSSNISCSNILICQNYIKWEIVNNTGASIYNVIISNNIINGSNIYQLRTIELGNNISGTITNNVISGPNGSYSIGDAINVNNFLITNNIINRGNILGSNNAFSNNISNGSQLPVGNNNQLNVDMSNVYVILGSTDGSCKLKPGSPAIGAGINGVDCGAFGGAQPYVLSGIPAGPSVYEINTSSTTGSTNGGLDVNVKAKIH